MDVARELAGGDRRSIGKADAVAAYVLRNKKALADLIAALNSNNAVIRMRAADAAEKVSVSKPEWLNPYASALLQLAETSGQQEMRWHLAQILPRLDLSPARRRRAIGTLFGYLEDNSRIVRAMAMTALVELADGDKVLRRRVATILDRAAKSSSPSLRARAKKLRVRMASE